MAPKKAPLTPAGKSVTPKLGAAAKTPVSRRNKDFGNLLEEDVKPAKARTPKAKNAAWKKEAPEPGKAERKPAAEETEKPTLEEKPAPFLGALVLGWLRGAVSAYFIRRSVLKTVRAEAGQAAGIEFPGFSARLRWALKELALAASGTLHLSQAAEKAVAFATGVIGTFYYTYCASEIARGAGILKNSALAFAGVVMAVLAVRHLLFQTPGPRIPEEFQFQQGKGESG